jgi:S-sulfosulfanyl-L-cysteine sulfohydrolase
MIGNNCLPKRSIKTCKSLLALFFITTALAMSGCGGDSSSSTPVAAATTTPTVALEILWMNDTHGYFVPTYHAEYTEVDSYATTAATEGTVGGYARIAGMVKGFKAKATDALFVDGGDTFDGSPIAQLTQGTAVVPVLNKMGIDVGIPGNRDFAWNKESFLAVAGCNVVGVDCTIPPTFTTTGVAGGNNGFSGDPVTVAPGTSTPGLSYPLIAANLLDAVTQLPVLPRYYIKQTPNLKIAFIGITSPLAGSTKKADGTAGFLVEGALTGSTTPNGFKIENEISSLAATIRQKENPDLIVVISHMGYFQDRKFASRSTGIDVIVGAHTHHIDS